MQLGKVDMLSGWVEPFLWCIGEFQWSEENNEDENVVERRRKSCTFAELACAVDILTGGRVGQRGASLAEKADVCKRLWSAASVTFRLKKKVKGVTKLPTLAPFGLTKMEGLS